MSRSTYMLIAFAPPAAIVPPSTTAAISHGDGTPPAARTMVGIVVTSSSSMIRGLVRATYARTVSIGPGSRDATRSAHLGRPQAAGRQQQPHRAAPQRGADRQVRNHEEGGEPRRDVQQPQGDLGRHEHDEGDGEATRQRRVGRAMDGDGRPHHECRDDEAHRTVGGVDGLGIGRDLREQRAIHERDVAEGQARALAGDPRAEQHLGEDRHGSEGDEARKARPCVRGRHRSAARPIGDEDDRREDGERHRQVGGDELGGESLDHDRRTEQGLDDDKGAGHDGGGEERAVVAAVAEDGDEPDRCDQGTDEGGRDEPMSVLDPGVEIGRRQPVAEAQRPVGAAQAGIRGANQAAHGDQDEGGDGSGNRKLGESGQRRSNPSRPLRLTAMPSGRCPS